MVRTLRSIEAEGRAASEADQFALSAWSGWGGLGPLFDESKADWQAERDELKELLTEQEYAAARTGVLNAHYTHPQYVSAIWETLSSMGVAEGNGLEPGCGAGTFIGLAPEGVRMTGVELDPITASVAANLYPSAEIRAEGYQDTPTTRLFDVAVGNVPFGDIRLYDPAGNPGGHSIHNHFIIKALSQTKPGGVVAVLSSHYTLDTMNPGARRDMYERADLLGAVRLPSGAHSEIAGTEVVTDVLLFRVRKDGEAPQPFTWEHSQRQVLPGSSETVPVNEYFTAHPDRVLGTMTTAHGLYGAVGLVVEAPDGQQLSTRLTSALQACASDAESAGLTYDPTPPESRPLLERSEVDAASIGHIRRLDDGTFEQLGATGFEILEVPSTQRVELGRLLELRDATRQLLEAESSITIDTPALEQARQRLSGLYEAYVADYGPLNRATVTARVDAKGEERVTVRRPPVFSRFFNRDPFAPLTRAIELYDQDTEIAAPAPLLRARQVYASYTPKGAEDAADALAMSLEARGRVDVDYCGYLLGTDATDAREQLRGLVFTAPDGALIPREEYLSGNVRAKLKEASEAAIERPEFAENVTALREVMPRDLTVADITPEPGAPWIPIEYHQQFIRDSLKIHASVAYNPAEGWKVTGGGTYGVAQTATWGTPHMTAQKIYQSVLNGSPIRVTYKDDDNREQLDPKATEAAKGKAEQIQARFKEWIWESPVRTEHLLETYNKRFNSLVPRDYDQAGSRLRLPGLATTFTLREHQKAAIARMIAEPTTGLFHEVGAGKTLEMICGAMEQKRLGLISKPMVVVPNHMLAQFEREWLQAYPHARILAADSDDIASRSGRGDFMARVTTSDWDAVICTQSAFKKIGVQADTYEHYDARQMRQLEAWMEESSDTFSVRAAESKRQRMAQDLRKKAAKHQEQTDGGVTFEQLGVDYLIVDEAHHYKNLSADTRTQGVIASENSAKAADLDMKLDWLRSTHGDRVATFATATPIANTMGEMWVMNHYLRPDLLQAAGMSSFDAWVKTFGQIDSRVEVTPAGKLRVTQRLAKFQNLPELMTMWGTFADVKTRDDLDLPLPELVADAEGNRAVQTVSVNVGNAMREFGASLLTRAEAIQSGAVEPTEDNFLALTHDGKSMATDHRLLHGHSRDRALWNITSPIGEQKVDVMARTIAQIFHETKDNTYVGDDGAPSPLPGALQLVFADQGTPKTDRWHFYGELKQLLVEQGVPADKIVFAQDAKTTVDKDRMFARARTGAIAVLIGSTEKMGTGANMQARAIALHHATAPWRPADIAQREGRIIRQGNQNAEVSIFRYVTEESFDTYSWQTLERKASFINQVMGRKYTGRELAGDISDEEMSYAQVKAIASGNPLVMEEARLKNLVSSLSARSEGHDVQQRYLKQRLPGLERMIAATNSRADLWERVASTVRSTAGDAFEMTLRGVRYTDRAEAAGALQHAWNVFQSGYHRAPDTYAVIYTSDPVMDMNVGGLKMSAAQLPHTRNRDGYIDHSKPAQYSFMIDSLDGDRTYWNSGDGALFTDAEMKSSPLGVLRRIENHLTALPARAARMRNDAADTREEHQRIRDQIGAANPWREKLEKACTELAKVTEQMQQHETGQDTIPGLSSAPTVSDPLAGVRAIAKTFTTPSAKSSSAALPPAHPPVHIGPNQQQQRGPTR